MRTCRLAVALLLVGCADDASPTSGTGGGTGASSSATSTAGPGGTTGSGTTGAGGSGGAPVTLRVAVISDLNDSYGSTTYGDPVHAAVEALTENIQPDVVLVTGDMVAGQQAGLDYEAMWVGFHAAVTTPLHAAGIPVAVTPGNHDASGYPAFAEERDIFVAQWSEAQHVPAVEMIDASSYPLRYSFTVAGAFFLSLDATTIGPISAEQRQWVAGQLDAASAYPVKIAYGHIPLHSVAVGREEEILDDEALETLFRDHGLTVYISGHHHAYYPGARDGLRLVSTSCLGSGPRALIGTADPTPRSVLSIDIEDGVVTSLEALLSPDFATAIERTSLPESLSYGGKSVMRDNLAGF